MKIGFYISTMGGNPLQVGLERGLKELGHEVTYGQGQDLTVIFNQCSHTRDYVYPEPFPTGKIAFVDTAEYGFFTRLPDRAHKFQNLASEGSMKHDTKNEVEQRKLLAYLEGKHFPYFIREYVNFLPFPPEYHPIDYPLYMLTVCSQKPDKHEYLNRTVPLWTSWGLSHPWRKQIGDAAKTIAGVTVMENTDIPSRVPQFDYFDRIREAKCSMSFDGYGSSSFRLTEVVVRTVLLRGPLSIRQYAPLTDMVNCVDFQVEHDGETFVSTNIAEKIQWVLDNPGHAYEIYNAGYHHCMEFLTEKATAQYLLNTIEAHDYSKPTQLHL